MWCPGHLVTVATERWALVVGDKENDVLLGTKRLAAGQNQEQAKQEGKTFHKGFVLGCFGSQGSCEFIPLIYSPATLSQLTSIRLA